MIVAMTETPTKRLSTKEVADRAGISRKTLLRWVKDGKIPEPDQDRNGWRAWSDVDAARVIEYANRIVPHPLRRQTILDL